MLGFASSPHVRSGWWFSAGSVAACMYMLSICADASLHDRQTYRQLKINKYWLIIYLINYKHIWGCVSEIDGLNIYIVARSSTRYRRCIWLHSPAWLMMSPLESVLIKKEKQFVNITHEREYIKGEWGFYRVTYLEWTITRSTTLAFVWPVKIWKNSVQGFEWRSPGVLLAEGSWMNDLFERKYSLPLR